MEYKRKKVVCIYHSPCADGFGAAWVLKQYFDNTAQYVDAEFIEGRYGMAPPNVEDACVVIVDFSFPRETLTEMGKSAERVLVLDHHRTAEADLVGFPPPEKDIRTYSSARGPVQCLFDMSRSGAVMAWEFFYPTVEIPALLSTIQDRDLWRFDYHDTKEVMAAVFAREYDFVVWDELMQEDLDVLREEGRVLLASHLKNIREHIDRNATEITITLSGGVNPEKKHLTVPCLNAPAIWASDAGHIMADSHPSQMAMIWQAERGKIKVSLRSVDAGPDVAAIAKMHGGGGHKNAAGYVIDRKVGPWW